MMVLRRSAVCALTIVTVIVAAPTMIDLLRWHWAVPTLGVWVCAGLAVGPIVGRRLRADDIDRLAWKERQATR